MKRPPVNMTANATMSHQEQEAVANVLGALAEKLGYAATELFRIMVEAQVIQAIGGGIMLMLAVVGAVAGSYIAYRLTIAYYGTDTFKEAMDDSGHREHPDLTLMFVGVSLAVIGGAIGLLFGGIIGDILMALTVPEYLAIQELTDMAQGFLN